MKLQGKIKTYSLNINDNEEKKEYDRLMIMLKDNGVKYQGCLPFQYKHPKPGSITIDTGDNNKNLFDNQFNTADNSVNNPNCRLFDHHEALQNTKKSKHTRTGYYLVPNNELNELRQNTFQCGYCGHKVINPTPDQVFCDHCLDSEYLVEEDLNLLRLQAVSDKSSRGKLSETELKILKPLYMHAQTVATDSKNKGKLEKQKTDIIRDYEIAIYNAKTEHDGLLWLMDNNINIDNCIYYSHTDKFSFGWRNPVSDDVKNALLDIISEFPYAYEIKCEDGKTLEGY